MINIPSIELCHNMYIFADIAVFMLLTQSAAKIKSLKFSTFEMGRAGIIISVIHICLYLYVEFLCHLLITVMYAKYVLSKETNMCT